VRYVVFAIAAGLSNLASQEAVVRLFPVLPTMGSVLVGTGVGFLIKYLLDKRWIFHDTFDTHGDEVRKIVVYGFSGVGTTLIFWAAELGFWHLGQTVSAKYIGAALGLSIGNAVKYLLDRKFVFSKQPT